MNASDETGPFLRIFLALACAAGSLVWLATTSLPLLAPAPNAADSLARRGLATTPVSLFKAAAHGDTFALSLLCSKGLDPRLPDGEGRTPLMLASAAGHLESVRLLESRTTAPLAKDKQGRTALSHAVENKHPEVTAFLLSRMRAQGLGTSLPPEPLVAAARNEDSATLGVLLDAGATRGLDDALAIAVSARSPGVARQLLRQGASPDTLVKGAPAILSVLGADGREMLELLLFFGARADRPDADGETALLRAIAAGDRSLVAMLLKAGADPNRFDHAFRTPLFAAVTSGHETLATLLLEHGADIHLRFPDGLSVLGRALKDRNWDAARQLISDGADPDAPCDGELSPMEIAFRDRNPDLARFLLDGGAIAHPSLLFRAMEAGATDIVDLLLDHGAPINTRDAHGDTLLTRACREGDLDLAARLVFRGANTRVLGPEGQEPLLVAIATRQPRIVELLLNSGADPNRAVREPVSEAFLDLAANKSLSFYLKRDTRFAPLMVAAAVGESDTIRALLRNGAERYPKTKGYQRYPISFAAEAKNIEAQQLLVGYDPKSAEHAIRIVIDLASQNATLYKDGAVALTSKVSTGTASNPTPTGDFVITNKHRTWTSTLYHCPMPYFMRLSCAAFGMHVGYVPNYPASHGCIRMPEQGAVAFWNVAPVGTPVSIIDSSKTSTASNP